MCHESNYPHQRRLPIPVVSALSTLRRVLPGLGALVVGGLLTRAIAEQVPVGSELVVAVVLGLLVGNTVGVPGWARPGVATNTLVLEAGIVLMGATVAVDRIVDAGPTVVGVVLAAVVTTVVMVEGVARLARIPEKVGSLLAAGSGICGVSAVAAVAGSIRPDDRQVAYAAATILLFDAVTLFVYPLVGSALGLSDVVFGVWAGTTMFSTGPVTAAGFAYSDTAGQWAVLVKLARNTLIGVVAVGYAVFYSRRSASRTADGDGGGRSNLRHLWASFPTFVVGFLFVMALASAGYLSDGQVAVLDDLSNWLFLVAFVGLGTTIDVSEFRETGIRPVAVVLVTLLTVSSVMLGVAVAVF